MRLFSCLDGQVDCSASDASVVTPLGRVKFEATVGGEVVSDGPPTSAYRLRNEGRLLCWNREAFDLELLLCRPVLPRWSLVPEYPLTDCWAGMWRMEARSPSGPCLFAAVWEAGYKWLTGFPDCGEHLYAWAWDDGHSEVAVGTQDEELLALRAERGDDLPNAWKSYFSLDPGSQDSRTCAFWRHESHDRLRNTGVAIPLPSLEAGQQFQIHAAVAWADYHKESTATWYAVDCEANNILNGAGCL